MNYRTLPQSTARELNNKKNHFKDMLAGDHKSTGLGLCKQTSLSKTTFKRHHSPGSTFKVTTFWKLTQLATTLRIM